jgi:ferritin
MALKEILNNDTPTGDKTEKKLIKNSLISEHCIDMLNFRAQEEEKSSRMYEDMYMFLDNLGYTGAGALWHKYAHEEMAHVDWARAYLLGLGIQPEIREMPKIISDYKGLPDIIQKSYEHEVEITKQCKELASAAMSHGDHMLYELALKYVKEQHEELTKMQTWLDKLEAFGTDATALRFLDNEMAELAK